MSTLKFPSGHEFDTVATARNKPISKWADLPSGNIYAIVDTETKVTKHGDAVVGRLETETGDGCRVWLLPRLGDELMGHELPVYVRVDGLRETRDGHRHYHAYTLIRSQ